MLYPMPIHEMPKTQAVYEVKDTATLDISLFNNTSQPIYYSGRTDNGMFSYCNNGFCGLDANGITNYADFNGTITSLSSLPIRFTLPEDSFILNPQLTKNSQFFISFSNKSIQDALTNNALKNVSIYADYQENSANSSSFGISFLGEKDAECIDIQNNTIIISCT